MGIRRPALRLQTCHIKTALYIPWWYAAIATRPNGTGSGSTDNSRAVLVVYWCAKPKAVTAYCLLALQSNSGPPATGCSGPPHNRSRRAETADQQQPITNMRSTKQSNKHRDVYHKKTHINLWRVFFADFSIDFNENLKTVFCSISIVGPILKKVRPFM